MKVKFVCNCGNHFEVEESNIKRIPADWRCLFCNGKFSISNLDEILELDIYRRAKEYLQKWFKSMGIEAACEMIERNKEQACYKIYRELLDKMGL